MRRDLRLLNHFCHRLILLGASMEFSMDDKTLRCPFLDYAPHEPSAALRMQQLGWPGPKIMDALNLRGTQLMNSLEKGLEAQNAAARRGCVIHDARL